MIESKDYLFFESKEDFLENCKVKEIDYYTKKPTFRYGSDDISFDITYPYTYPLVFKPIYYMPCTRMYTCWTVCEDKTFEEARKHAMKNYKEKLDFIQTQLTKLENLDVKK